MVYAPACTWPVEAFVHYVVVWRVYSIRPYMNLISTS